MNHLAYRHAILRPPRRPARAALRCRSKHRSITVVTPITICAASSKTVAVVGASPDPARPSYRIAAYLLEHGYDVIPVNPDAVGHTLFGKPVLRSLAEVDRAIDLVDVFRRPAAVPALVREVVPLRIPFLWMQLGVRHDEACGTAERAGIDVVMDRCMKREHLRLMASLAKDGA